MTTTTPPLTPSSSAPTISMPPPPPPPAGARPALTPASAAVPTAAPSPVPTDEKPARRLRSRLVRSFGVAFALAAVVASYLIDGQIFAPVILLFIIVVPFEKLYPRKKGQKIRRPMVGTDVSFALISPLINAIGVAAAVVIGSLSLFWLPGLALRPLVAMLPPIAVPILAFFLFDMLAYWTHRWAHEVPFLWRFHAVHHSPEHMDWISGFRIHPFDGVLIAPAFFFLIAAGIDVEIAGVLALLQIVLGLFFHANVRVRWRLLDRVVANPEFHHWHHSNESDAIGHNYAPALPVWDLIFGTYFMPKGDRRPTHYGVDEPMPRTLVGMLTHPLRGARSHLRLAWHPIRLVKAAWRGLRTLLPTVWQSTTRPTHSVRRETVPGSFSTNASLFDPADAPGLMPDEVSVSVDGR